MVGWATPQLHDIDALAKMADPALDGLYPVKALSRFADVIALCLQVMSVLLHLTFLFSLRCEICQKLHSPGLIYNKEIED